MLQIVHRTNIHEDDLAKYRAIKALKWGQFLVECVKCKAEDITDNLHKWVCKSHSDEKPEKIVYEASQAEKKTKNPRKITSKKTPKKKPIVK